MPVDHDAILIAIVVLICIILVVLIDLYRHILNLHFHQPDAMPPDELRATAVFLPKKSKKRQLADEPKTVIAGFE